MRRLLMMAAAILAATAPLSPLMAAEHRILMLNYGKEGGMVFEPSFVKAELGDTISFVPENSGHSVQSYVVPEGETPWKSKLDEAFTVTVDHEGIYLYYCPPHLMMAMIGVIQVGAPTNLDIVKQKAEKLRPKLVMKGERLDAALLQIKLAQ
ncbi:pseudoazurin [Agrobacterium larrymoorei]|uniref:Pseudoazurin n=1 Tax=Agrobacterium larrymoorei TaxID=160699 RepID=A0ABU0UK17_9HYPH|nr:pseudoazurin [Agrobacterium larrymoorei]MDQ1185208.1 pseudoazurin [Agrobacterium larrymoorei]